MPEGRDGRLITRAQHHAGRLCIAHPVLRTRFPYFCRAKMRSIMSFRKYGKACWVWVLCLPVALFAQHLQVGLALGGTNYQGELQESRYNISRARFAFGASMSYFFNSRLALRGQVFKGNVGGNDKFSSRTASQARNLSFTTRLYEVSLVGMGYLLNPDQVKVAPYAFAGVATFRINPYTYDNAGVQQYLIPLSTEGQGLPQYPDRQKAEWYNWSVPMGLGFTVWLNDHWSADLEVGYRKTFTDYIDDVSKYYVDPAILQQAVGPKSVELSYRGDELPNGNPNYPGVGSSRGNPATSDWYYATLLRLNYLFGGRQRKGGSGPAYNKKQYGCPTVW